MDNKTDARESVSAITVRKSTNELCLVRYEESDRYHTYEVYGVSFGEIEITYGGKTYCEGILGKWQEALSAYAQHCTAALQAELEETRKIADDFQEMASKYQTENERLRKALEPDMFWDDDDPERPHDSPDDILGYYAERVIVKMTCAVQCPPKWAFYLNPAPDAKTDDLTYYVFDSEDEAGKALAAINEVSQ